jgi:hypothetical protein
MASLSAAVMFAYGAASFFLNAMVDSIEIRVLAREVTLIGN